MDGRARQLKMVRDARYRAKKAGVECTINHLDIEWPEFCPVFGFELDYGPTGRQQYDSPSLDRIDPTLGYTPGNVRVISWRANFLKANANAGELEMLLAWLRGEQHE